MVCAAPGLAREVTLGGLYRDGELVEPFTMEVPDSSESLGAARAQAGTPAAVHPGAGRMGAPELSAETQRRNGALAAAAQQGDQLREEMRTLASQGEAAALASDQMRELWKGFMAAAREVRRELRRVDDEVIARGLPEEVLARSREALDTHKRGVAEVRRAFNDVRRGEPGAVERAVEVLNRLQFRYDPPLLSAAPSFATDRREAPRIDVSEAYPEPTRPEPTPGSEAAPEASTHGGELAETLAADPPTPADLAATIDVQLTAAITAKAAELGNSPVRIYEFVRNGVEFQAYLGSRKGSAETLTQLAGNDTDQASLLLALLRAAGIPSRYVRGTLEITPEQAKAWLRVDDAATAASILTTAGLDGVAVVSGPNVVAVRFTHVWVEAYVPYANYRGVPNGTQEKLWVPLDPSLKQSEIEPGQDVLTPLGFDIDAYLADYISTFHAPSPIEKLVSDVQAYLDASAPGTTVADVERTSSIAARSLGILPMSLPARQLAVASRFAALEAAKRYKVRFRLYNGATTFIDYTADLPAMITKRVTIEYVGATPADQTTIDSFGTIYNTPPNLVNVKPILKLDGTAVATSANAIGMGRTHSSDMHFTQPTGASNVQPLVQNQIIAGNGQAIAFDTFLDVRDAFFTGGGFTVDNTLESVLHSTAVDYLDRVDRGQERAERLMQMVTIQDVSEAIVENSIAVSLSFGTPVSFEWTGLTVDADRRIIGPFHVGGNDAKSRPYMILTGMDGSIMENRVFEDLFDQEAVSTIKILELASDAGIPICTIDSSIAADCPGITQPTSILSAINTALAAGHVVTIPRAPITVGQWSGTGYIDMQSSGAAGYIISGGISSGGRMAAGGATVDSWGDYLPFACQETRDAEILSPEEDAPDQSAVFCANGSPVEFTVDLTVFCDYFFFPDGERTFRRVYRTHRSARDIGPGDYEFRVPLDSGGFVARKIALVGVEIKRVLSNQVGGAECNAVPDHKGRSLLLMGTSGGNAADLIIEADVKPRQYGQFARVGVQRAGRHLLGEAPVGAALTPLAFDTQGQRLTDRVISGCDVDSSGTLDPSEVAAESPFFVRAETPSAYGSNVASLEGLGGIGSVGGPFAAAFARGVSAPGSVVMRQAILHSKDPSLTHPVGAVWPAGTSCVANVDVETFNDGTVVSDAVEEDAEIVEAVALATSANISAILSCVASGTGPIVTCGPFAWTIKDPFGAFIDPDLFLGFGGVTARGLVDVKVNKATNAVTEVHYFGKLEDLYDFDAFSILPYASTAAAVQMGYPTLGPGGRVTRKEVIIDRKLLL